ncbi:MAG: ribonuclease P protein component 4 [Methanocellales archaeon]|nr:ribonuclease P protein component 4 [Methanocellales archaeon]
MKRKSWIRDMARQRIERLFMLAEKQFGEHPERSDRYIQLARRIGTRNNVRIPRELKQRMCKHCDSYLVPGTNARVRLRKRYVTVTCLTCNKQMRYPYP